jgi:hypothetical protein
MKAIILKIITIMTLIVMLLSMGANIYIVNAAERLSPRESTRDLERVRAFYPSIARKVDELKKRHPNWKFEFVNTGYTFEQMTRAQFGEGRGLNNSYAPINLIESYGGKYFSDAWIDQARAHLGFDANTAAKRWQAPSLNAIKYMMDPRTYLNENNIFTFMSLQGSSKFGEAKSKEIVASVLAGTKNAGREGAVYNVSRDVDIDLLELATKLKQEGGLEPQLGIDAYNPLNIGATGHRY